MTNNQTLYSLSKNNKWKIWKASTNYIVQPSKGIEIIIQWGYEDGKQQTKSVWVVSGKNLGKSNETTIQQQTDLKLQQLYQKQFDDDYFTDKSLYVKTPKAQLAHKYKDKKHLIEWGLKQNPNKYVWASTKLNGIRCNVHIDKKSIVKFTSREYKEFKYLTHLVPHLDYYVNDNKCMLDGELYHPDIPFEILSSLINSDDYVSIIDPDTNIEWKTSDVQYHIYDYVDYENIDDDYFDRFIDFKDQLLAFNKNPLIKIVSNVAVESEEEMKELALKWISEGYEGLMIRYGSVPYEFGERSSYLLKYKVMEQEEFKIKKIYLAENDPTKVQIVCYNHHNSNEDYNTFDLGSIKGNKEQNIIKYYNNKHLLEDKAFITVDYQVLSKYLVPLFPVGIDIREGYLDKNNKFIPNV